MKPDVLTRLAVKLGSNCLESKNFSNHTTKRETDAFKSLNLDDMEDLTQ